MVLAKAGSRNDAPTSRGLVVPGGGGGGPWEVWMVLQAPEGHCQLRRPWALPLPRL